MKARVILIIAAGVLAVVTLGWLLMRAGNGPAADTASAIDVQPTPTPAPMHRITLLFPASDGLLHPELREVRLPVEVEQRARVVVLALLEGPSSGLGPVFPYPSELLGVYVDGEGRGYIDLTGPPDPLGGSHTEIMLAYGTVNSVLLNCPELTSVQLLFSGTEVPSLTGHLDLSKPLSLNKRFIAVR